METPKLKPCPFCGSRTNNLFTDETLAFLPIYSWACSSCIAIGPRHESIEAAAGAWNNRAPTPESARIEQLESELAEARKTLNRIKGFSERMPAAEIALALDEMGIR